MATGWRRPAGLLSRRNLKETRARLTLAGPLAFRSLRTRWAAGALIALAVALSVTVYVLFTAFFGATQQAVARRVRPLVLPGDLVVRASEPLAEAFTFALGRQANVTSVRLLTVVELMTTFGRVEVLGYDQPMAADGSFAVGEGRAPQADDEIMIPPEVAAEAGLRVGDTVQLMRIIGTQLATQTMTIVGLGRSRQEYLAGFPVVTVAALRSGLTVDPNTAIVQVDQEINIPRVERYIKDLWMEVYGGAPPGSSGYAGPSVIWARSPEISARALVGGVFSSGRLAVLLVYLFATLGLLNIILLSFLQRKRPLGVLKALGLDNGDLLLYLLLEAVLMALIGLAAGLSASGGLIWYLNRHTANSFLPSGWSAGIAALLSLALVYVASWLPVTLTQRAPVNALLQNRRVYLDSTSACAQCGRCGGF